MVSRVIGFAGLCACLVFCGSAWGLTLAKGGRPTLQIRRAAGAGLVEQTAATELQTYLAQIIGRAPDLVTEEDGARGPAIYVGQTAFAQSHGIDSASLAPEEWVIRRAGDSLILTGGKPRGVLYAVYRFLETELGVRWWTPWEEEVPKQRDLDVSDELSQQSRPVLAYRDIYMLYGEDDGAFAARNRLNRDGDRKIDARYGGCRDYGPPYHVHTFYLYVKPAEYLDTHPEYFSLVNGKRVATQNQLCLSNQELRDLFVEKLRTYIRESEAQAEAAGAPPPIVYDISQNDWAGQCQCDACQAIVKREESEAGLMLDFVNEIAERIAVDYPYVLIDTLAYQYTQKPPAHIKARDNVIIRLCDTGSNATAPITSEENTEFREFLLSWAKVANNLRVWDYAVTYQAPLGLPYPSEGTYAEDFRFYAENHVEGVFTELEYPVQADCRDLKVWLMAKLLEDPYRDPLALAREFAQGFYGAAGEAVLAYRDLLVASQARHGAIIGMGPAASAFTFLDMPTVLAAQEIFDRSARAVATDPVLSRRLRHARLGLDRATLARLRTLLWQWRAAGHEESFPLDLALIRERVRKTWTEQATLRLPEAQRAESLAAMDAEIARYSSMPVVVDLPERFRGKPAGTVFDFPADMTRNWQDIVTCVKDPEAESGVANCLRFPNKSPEEHPLEKYGLPMPWGLYVQRSGQFLAGSAIEAKDIPGPGYHWYHMGPYPLPQTTYLYFFWSWIIQQDLGAALDPAVPEREYDLWAHIKFTGPAYPHGKAEDANAIWVERVVLEASGGQGK